ncbi:metallophosphatase domain-containing protein [uncultured Parasphingopyxis sp.]|uniref:metallophosphatase domain-containing protein n=1 Tax=uncultured Parasphingopyxis sp. TaxID=1547918 RepID=UPI002639E23D|nr:metallophosphatase domain-containing protein [uncultured Parasphingopyxis sp.]
MAVSITIISDTHQMHEDLVLPGGDILIHCGDFLELFDRDGPGLGPMDEWFGRQNYHHVLVTGGNHDIALENAWQLGVKSFENAELLIDEEVTVSGLRIYGAPWLPDLPGHAFYLDDEGLRRKWSAVPSDVDILITHVPPFGILDRSSRGMQFGCAHLRDNLPRIAPRLHCFGHVHASAGEMQSGATLFVNASSAISGQKAVRPPFTIEMAPR